MIVPMKKATIIVQSKDSDATVASIRSLGMLHVEHEKAPKAENIATLKEQIELVSRATRILSRLEFSDATGKIQQKEANDWKFTSRHIIDCDKRLNQLQDYSRRLKGGISQWQEWGDFDPAAMQNLSKKNVYIRLFQVPVRDIKKFPSGVIVKIVSKSKGLARCVVISQKRIDIPFKEVNLPKMSLAKMRSRLTENNRCIDLIREEIRKHNTYLKCLAEQRKSLGKDLEFQEAVSGMGQSENIDYIKGYIPVDATESLLATAKKEKWGITISDPGDDDSVPTMIRNPKWVSIINPVFKAIEVIPGYRELDISLWFLVFLSIFFGMLIGDAGYGIIFLLLTMIFKEKFAKKLKENSVFNLLYLFGFCAIGWGVLSGTFFGQAWLPQWVKPVLPILRDDKVVQTLCFFLGALHLSIGHLWRAIRKLPSLLALSDIGWVCVLWGAFFLARTLILGEAMPVGVKWFFIVGPILVVLFTASKRNIFKRIGAGTGNLLLNLVNSFTDVVSYIRLFAVGLATVAVADAFNKMAMNVGFNSVVSGTITVFILFLGHTLNIVLGPMSVLVHGVRLNVLEFCNHVDIKWSGFAYRPLRG